MEPNCEKEMTLPLSKEMLEFNSLNILGIKDQSPGDGYQDTLGFPRCHGENRSKESCNQNDLNAEIRRRKLHRKEGNMDDKDTIKVLDEESKPVSVSPSAPLLEVLDPDCDMKDDKTVNAPNDGDYQRPAKLDLIVGFLRLFNFLSSVTAVFGIVVSIHIPLLSGEENYSKLGQLWTIRVQQVFAKFSSGEEETELTSEAY